MGAGLEVVRASEPEASAAQFGCRFGNRSVAMPRTRCESSAYGMVRSAGPRGVRYGLGRGRRFGRPRENSFPVFGLLAPNRALRWIESLRVDGSIPSLATTSNFLIFMSFRASPADYRASFWPENG